MTSLFATVFGSGLLAQDKQFGTGPLQNFDERFLHGVGWCAVRDEVFRQLG